MSTQTAAKRSRARTPNNQATTGFRISDVLWAVMRPLIPERANTHRFGGGRPRAPDRRCADAIFYVLRTGSQWAALCETGSPVRWSPGVPPVCSGRAGEGDSWDGCSSG
jgi:putative transposase